MLDDASNDAPITGDDDIVSRAVQNVADLPGEDNQYDVAATIDDEPASEVTGAGEDAATTDEPSPAADEPTPAAEPATDDGFAPADAPVGDTDIPAASYENDAPQPEAEPAPAGEGGGDVQRSIKEGIAAFKSVYEATQKHQTARNTLRDMREQLDADTAQLQHRIAIEQSYPQIVSEQTAELNEASALSEQSLQRAATLDTERNQLESQLAADKKRHEDQLRPYRNVAESTKGRADDTANTLADVKRAIKSAETTLAEATKRRDQRLASANRSVDNAEERLRRVQADLDDARADEAGNPDVIARLEAELASEQAHLSSAKADIPTITEEGRVAVESAQQSLFRQKKVLTQAERDAEAAKKEASERRAEYDAMLKKTQDAEQALSDQIKQRISGAEEARKQAKDAQARMEAAKKLLDEAEQIHSTPQQTIALRDQIAFEQAEYDRQQDAVDELAANERTLRKKTFKQRLILILGGIAIVVLAIAIAVAIFSARNAKPATTSSQKPQTETAQPKDEAKDKKEEEKADTKADEKKDDSASSSSSSSSSSDSTAKEKESGSSSSSSSATGSSSSSKDSESSSSSSNSTSSNSSSGSSSSSSTSEKTTETTSSTKK